MLLMKHIKENRGSYILISTIFIIGMLIGNYKVLSLEGGVQEYLTDLIDRYVANDNLAQWSTQALFYHSFLNQAKIIAGIWFLGLTIIGAPLILTLVFYKAFSLGFTVGFLVYAKQGAGIVISLISIFPQNLVYIPCVIVWSVVALNFSLFIVRRGRLKTGTSLSTALAYYTLLMLVYLLIIAVGAFIEAALSPWLLKLLV